MCKSFLVVALLLSSVSSTYADEHDQENTVASDRYLIVISEYRLEPPAPELSEGEIIALIKEQGGSPIETLRLTVMGGVESMVQFGKSVAVTTGTVNNGRQIQRIQQEKSIGTILRVNVTPAEQNLLAKIDFESSRLGETKADDSSPDVLILRVQISRTFELGVPSLLGSTSVDQGIYLVATIQSAND